MPGLRAGSPMNGAQNLRIRLPPGYGGGLSTVPAGEDSEERLDIRVGGRVAVAVEVGRAAGGAAVACQAGEEGFDVGVGGGVAVVVEVGRAAGGAQLPGLVVGVEGRKKAAEKD